MEKDLISIVIPVYNAEKYIKDTIATIEEQTYENWEAIFVDDCSTDNSYKILKNNINEKMKIIKLNKNSGPAIARNKGIELANGRYIAFLDADDLWDKEKNKKQIEFMKKNDYAFTYTAFKYISEDKKKTSKIIKVQNKLEYNEALKNTRILLSAVIIDLKQITKEQCKMLDVMCEDVATWWKILKQGHTAYAINESLVFYRKVKGSRGSNKLLSSIYRWKLYRRVEKLNILKSTYYFVHYIFNAIIKRI